MKKVVEKKEGKREQKEQGKKENLRQKERT